MTGHGALIGLGDLRYAARCCAHMARRGPEALEAPTDPLTATVLEAHMTALRHDIARSACDCNSVFCVCS